MNSQISAETALAPALRLISDGGPIVALLLALSVAASTVVIAKTWQFARLRLSRLAPARQSIERARQGRLAEALEALDRSPSPLSHTLRVAILGRLRKVPDPAAREEAERVGQAQLNELRKGLRLLEVVAALSPLLGLLGTLIGMIEAFQQLEAAGRQVNPSVLSGGIWQALLTTAVGISVAIPTVIALNWLESRIQTHAQRMGDFLLQVYTADLPLHQSIEAMPGKPRPDAKSSQPASALSS